MMFEITNFGTVILSFVIGFFIWILWQRRPPNSPPGKNGLPLLGVLLSLGTHPEKTMAKWAKKYGPVFMIKMGTSNVLVIASAEAAYEAYTKYEDFNDRPQSVAMFTGSKGIVFVNRSDMQKEQRRFGLNTLRQFGMGRRTLEPTLIEISQATCDKINDLCGKSGKSKPIEINHMMFDLTSSVISYMLLNHDACADDPEFFEVVRSLTEESVVFYLSSIMMFAPFLKYIFPFSYVWNKGLYFQKRFHKLARKEIKEHQATFDKNNLRDYVDCFLKEMNKQKGGQTEGSYDVENDEEFKFSSDWQNRSSFDEDQLVATIRDLYVAGTETTATTMTWILLFLSKHPEKQKKMQQEIDEVLGQAGVPKMAMMDKLPYLKAVIQETLRLKPVAPLSVPHCTTKRAIFKNYVIPKGTIIVTNLWGIQNDETMWPEPEKFMPERHLDQNGKFQKLDPWIPFNVGARNCVGQQLAKMELFISTVTIFRRFQFSFESGADPDLTGQNVVVLRPTYSKICAQRR